MMMMMTRKAKMIPLMADAWKMSMNGKMATKRMAMMKAKWRKCLPIFVDWHNWSQSTS